jgi:sigma-B regulation protein RsbU (phosphoserine phosphatase)
VFPQARFAWHYRPCEELAGDGLNVFALDDRHAGLYVFDVSGHGVAAALLSVSLSRVLLPPSDPSSVLRPDAGGGAAPTRLPTPPAEVAARLNRMFPFDEATEQFFTMVYGVLDVATGEFRYVSAGGPGLVHVPAAGEGRIVEDRGFPIGLADRLYEERALAMAPGDRIYLYSDGIPEAIDADGRVFGAERLLGSLGRARGEPLDRAVASLIDQLGRWTGSAGLRDDVSLVAAEFLGPSG